MIRVNLIIHLVKYFYTLLSLGIKNEGLEVARISPNPLQIHPPPPLKKSKQDNLTYSPSLYSTPLPSK